MKKTICCWIGTKDIEASKGNLDGGIGPIATVLNEREFDEVHLLNNFPVDKAATFTDWLRSHTKASIITYQKELSSPTNFEEIYLAVKGVLNEISEDVARTFHLSPGTPAMAAIWVLMAKTVFPSKLIETSQKYGTKDVEVPFEITAEFTDIITKHDRCLEKGSSAMPPEAPEFEKITYKCRKMRSLVNDAKRIAIRSVPVLLEGESGTGKELFARAIHRASLAKDGHLVTINCGAIPPGLIESELFGHTKGAFTGATGPKRGAFEMAHNGTLFLDEIGELPLDAQVRLLRVLEDGRVTPVGAEKSKKVNFRLITATNRNLAEEVKKGGFREDLFYRILVAYFHLPALRDRPGDLGVLISVLMEELKESLHSDMYYKKRELSKEAFNRLQHYRWPGNIRELKNTLLRAIIWGNSEKISGDDIDKAIMSISETRSGLLPVLDTPSFDLERVIFDVRSYYMQMALDDCQGVQEKAAEKLKISRQKLAYWMSKRA